MTPILASIMKAKKLLSIAVLTLLLLLVPLVAMQFSEQVNWGVADFLIAGIMIFTLGVSILYIKTKVINTGQRVLLLLLVVVLFLLLWAELAVGIFGSPFAGS